MADRTLIVALEIGAVAGVAIYAALRGRDVRRMMLSAGAFGFVAEELSQRTFESYHYSSTFLSIGRTPVAVVLAWSVILVSSRQLTERLSVRRPLAPVVDAGLALLLDLCLDAVAVRTHLWSWHGVALDEQWFGVPWANFVGWYLVAVAFGAASRTKQRPSGGVGTALTVFAATAFFVVGIATTHVAYSVGATPQPALAVVSLIGFTAAACSWCRHWTPTPDRSASVDLAVRMVLHGAFATILVLGGFAQGSPGLVVVILMVAAFERAVHHRSRGHAVVRARPSARIASESSGPISGGGVMTRVGSVDSKLALAAMLVLVVLGVAACRDSNDGPAAGDSPSVQDVGHAAGCDEVDQVGEPEVLFDAAGECDVNGSYVRIDVVDDVTREQLSARFSPRYASADELNPCEDGTPVANPIIAVGDGWAVFTLDESIADTVAGALDGTVLRPGALGPPVSLPLPERLVCPAA